MTGAAPRQPLPAALAQERVHGPLVSCAPRNCPHQCSQSSPPRAAARTTRRWRASSACSRRSSGTAGTGRTGPPPASSRSSGAGSVDTIRRGAAMRSVAARRPSSAPRWEGPRNGPRNRPQSPFLPLWDSFLLGRACPKPCCRRIQKPRKQLLQLL